MVVLPLKIKGLDVKIDVEFAMKFPFKSTVKVLALKEPLESVRLPFIVTSSESVSAAPPVFVTLRNSADPEGISAPVEISLAILYTIS